MCNPTSIDLQVHTELAQQEAYLLVLCKYIAKLGECQLTFMQSMDACVESKGRLVNGE